MEGEGQWQREQEGSEEEGLNQRGGAECHTGLPPQNKGASHSIPVTVLKLRGQCSGKVLTICSSREGVGRTKPL